MSLGEYGGRVLARLCEAAFGAGADREGQTCQLQRQLPADGLARADAVLGRGVRWARRPKAVARVGRFHAKNPALPFAADTEAEDHATRRKVMRQFARHWLDGVYQQLEAQRLAEAQ
jgi:hypothetical protein